MISLVNQPVFFFLVGGEKPAGLQDCCMISSELAYELANIHTV